MFSVSSMPTFPGYLARLPGNICHKSCQLAKSCGFMYLGHWKLIQPERLHGPWNIHFAEPLVCTQVGCRKSRLHYIWDIGRVHAAKVLQIQIRYMMIKARGPSTHASHLESALWIKPKAHIRSSVASASAGPATPYTLKIPITATCHWTL